MLLTIATPTESSVPSLIKILNSSILFTVVDGTPLWLLGTSESESLFKTCTDLSLVATVFQIVEWTCSQHHGDKTTSFSNGNRENASSTKPSTGTASKYRILLAFCMHVSSAKRTKTWSLQADQTQTKWSFSTSQTTTSHFAQFTTYLVKLTQWTFPMTIRCSWWVEQTDW